MTRHVAGDEVVVVDRFNVECERAGVVPLPVYVTRFHRVEVSTFDRPQACLDVAEIAAVRGATVPAGISIVAVHIPTLSAIWRGALTARDH